MASRGRPSSKWLAFKDDRDASAANRARRCGFTIVELLVTIGVIAIVISIMLPGLASARRQGVWITQQAAMQQLSTLLAAYTNDYKDAYPLERVGMIPDEMTDKYREILHSLGFIERTHIPPRVNHYEGIAENVLMSMALCYDAERMKPGITEARDQRKASVVRTAQVRYPSDKGVLRTYYDKAANPPTPRDHACCVVGQPALPVAFADGAVEVRRWQELLPQGILYTENDIGFPVTSTWNGVAGRDRK